ncbi:hypothetical protein RvY_13367 [Ramazzottius varieornatus]|uniref:Uncharacterized protein n=1 Tax=Ramazzottius varieornatus TaxID=947166 RepID=A0A1D1VRN4_RAMVA|nr:hypothetical protein RvY_13367 [Ramazzottius varieornatus]
MDRAASRLDGPDRNSRHKGGIFGPVNGSQTCFVLRMNSQSCRLASPESYAARMRIQTG